MRLLILLAASALYAQTPEFEVASIKPAAPPERGAVPLSGGPGTKDPERWTCRFMALKWLITYAYNVQPYQVSGPSWLDTERFDIIAKVPPGATREQFRLMLQHLLAERFGLKLHRERKEWPAYDLVVAKNGPKLKESATPENAEPPPFDRSSLPRDKWGLPVVPPGVNATSSTSDGRFRRYAVRETMANLASSLSMHVERPITDATGLTGKYDFVLTWTSEVNPPPEDPLPSLMTALQEQLGLRLESKKGEVEVLVIDQVNKTPTEN